MKNKKIKGITHSLLRYPGSKARLAKFIAEVISLNGFHRPIFIEPFCGGASVSIALLEANIVKEVVLNDIDPLLASLWKCIFSKHDAIWLADAVIKVPLTLEFWQFQKNLKTKNLRELALKCLYLNRTSFSGVLHSNAGPIGGRTQSRWTVGCRFNREKIASRILELSRLSNRVRSITQQSWKKVCKTWDGGKEVLFYLDPPFYHKSKRLYRYVFDYTEHKALRDYLISFRRPWILSYDNAYEIKILYNDFGLNARIIDNTYSAHPIGGNSFIGREIVYSNLKYLTYVKSKKFNHIGLSIRNYNKSTKNINNLIRIPII